MPSFLLLSHFTQYIAYFNPFFHFLRAAVVYMERLAEAVNRFQKAGLRLMEFSDVHATVLFVDKHTGVAVPYRILGNKDNISLGVYRMQMTGSYLNSEMQVAAESFAVNGGVDFQDIAGIKNHAVLHISGRNDNGDIVVGSILMH